MAKRYYSHDELLNKIKEGSNPFKPWGTMGRHKCLLKIENGVLFARGVEKNEEYDPCYIEYVVNPCRHKAQEYYFISKWVLIKKGGTLGYDCGNVWAIKPKSEMTPMQLLRTDFKIKRDNIIIISKDKTKDVNVEGLKSAISDDNNCANRDRFWGSGETWIYQGKFCALTEFHSFRGGVDQRRNLGKIYLIREHLPNAIKEAREAIEAYNKGLRLAGNIKLLENGLFGAP